MRALARAARPGAALTGLVQRRADIRFPLPERLEAPLVAAGTVAGLRAPRQVHPGLSSTTATVLLLHLGMSGRLVFDGEPCGPHEHLTFGFDDGTILRFVDPRRFGMLDLWPAAGLGEHRWLGHLGLEPLDPGSTAGACCGALAGRRTRAQGGADGPAARGRRRQHLRQREPVPRAPVADTRRLAASARARPSGWPGRSGRCCGEAIDGRRLVLARLRPVRTASSATSSAISGSTTAPASPALRCGRPIERIVQGARATYFCPRCQR